MARYGQAFRDRIVARLLPPESAAIDVVSREVGVSVGMLERWRAQALAAPGGLASSQRWTPAARLEAVITTAAMDEAARSAWCREQGLYPAELEGPGSATPSPAWASHGRRVPSRPARIGDGSRSSS